MKSRKMPKRKRSHPTTKAVSMMRPTRVSGIYRIQPSRRTGLTLGGRYEILGLLDRGGTSEVYLARDAYSESPVVIRMVTEEAAFCKCDGTQVTVGSTTRHIGRQGRLRGDV